MGAARSTAYRSAVTNGSALFLAEVSGNSPIARRFRDIKQAIEDDLGGVVALSEAQKQLVRRACLLSIASEQIEADLAQGNAIDLAAYSSSTNALRRLLTTLGLKRVAGRPQTLADAMRAARA